MTTMNGHLDLDQIEQNADAYWPFADTIITLINAVRAMTLRADALEARLTDANARANHLEDELIACYEARV